MTVISIGLCNPSERTIWWTMILWIDHRAPTKLPERSTSGRGRREICSHYASTPRRVALATRRATHHFQDGGSCVWLRSWYLPHLFQGRLHSVGLVRRTRKATFRTAWRPTNPSYKNLTREQFRKGLKTHLFKQAYNIWLLTSENYLMEWYNYYYYYYELDQYVGHFWWH